MRALKSPFPSTLRSSQFAMTSRVVRSMFDHLASWSISSLFAGPPRSLFLLVCLEYDLIDSSQECHGVHTSHKLCCARPLEQRVVAVFIPVALSPLLLRLEDVRLGVCRRCRVAICGCGRGREVLEDVLRVEEFGVDMLRRKEVAADDEDFGGDVST